MFINNENLYLWDVGNEDFLFIINESIIKYNFYLNFYRYFLKCLK